MLYHDEFTPGQVLKPDNARKTTAFYFSFLQFGDCLRSEYAWLQCCVVRHTVAGKVAGGMTCICKMVLRSFFCGDESFAAGCVLRVPDATLVFGKLLCLIADESAIKHTYATKGASGLVPCMKCKNVVLIGHDILENDASGYFVDLSATSGFDLATDADIWAKFDKITSMKTAGATAAALQQMEKALGINCVPNGILADEELRSHVLPIKHTAYDSMHCLFSNGIASQEMHLFLQLCSQHLGITFGHMEDWCKAGWRTAKHIGSGATAAIAVFSSRREQLSKDGFKGIASELLAIFPLMRHFIETVVKPRCPECMQDALASFAKLREAVAILNSMKRDSSTITQSRCDHLKSTLATHLRLFKVAYGPDHVRPKHHLCQHIPDQVLAHKMVIDCWPCERKHRSMKRLAGTIDNTRNFERSLMARAIQEQLQCTPEDSFGYCLIGKQIPAPDIAEMLDANSVTVSGSMRFGIVRLTRGDVIIADNHALRITACLLVDGGWGVLAAVYELAGPLGACRTWKIGVPTACFTLTANGFVTPTYWNFQPDGLLLTLE